MAITGFPVFLTLRDRAALIVGGGELALRKARLLAGSGARIVVVARDPLPDLAALAAEVRQRPFVESDLDGAVLVFVATDDAEEEGRAQAAATRRGLPVNLPDQPDRSSFIMPAIIDRAPVTVAISTGGAAPVLARWLRARVEAALDPRLGAFTTFLEGFRAAVRARHPEEVGRRRFWESVIDGPIARRFFAGDEAGARTDLTAQVTEAGPAPALGQVALVGAGPGDPDLLTLKALRALQNADVVVYDALVDARILDYVRRDARRIHVGKRSGHHTLPQPEINALVVAEARAGHRVARLKGGDAFIFGRGGEEVEACRAAGIPVAVVPGITAALGCAASTQIPLTHRGLSQGLTVVTAHGADGAEPKLDWAALARLDHTLVIYMGLSQAAAVSDRLVAAGMAAGTPAALVEKGSRPDQKLVVGTVATLARMAAAHQLTGPALIIIGPVAALADTARITPETGTADTVSTPLPPPLADLLRLAG